MYQKSDKNSIKHLFDNISTHYDFLNIVMSFGMHKTIKKTAVKNIYNYRKNLNIPVNNLKIADLCCGTGDMIKYLADYFPDSQIVGIDFSENMLKIAKEKHNKYKNVTFVNEDITNLPYLDGKFDICIISFGLRNTPIYQKTIIDIYKILSKNGTIGILDLGHASKFIEPLIYFYLDKIIPLYGKFIDANAYKYLGKSLKDFPLQKKLINALSEAHFTSIESHNYLLGIIAQQIATKT